MQFTADILEYSRRHKKVYIYGAGIYGENCYTFLKLHDIGIAGFITSDGVQKECNGKPVYAYEKIRDSLGSDCGIIIALNAETADIVIDRYTFKCDVLRLSQRNLSDIDRELCRELIVSEKGRLNRSKELPEKAGKILLIQLEVTYGDMIWSTALVRNLKKKYPESKIDLILNSKFLNIYENCPYINQLYPYDCTTLLDTVSKGMMDKVNNYTNEVFRNQRYNITILPRLLPVIYRDGIENLLLAQMIDTEYLIGHCMYAFEDQQEHYDELESIFSRLIKHRTAEHEAMNDLRLMEALGYIVSIEDAQMELWLSKKEMQYANEMLDISKINIAVAPVGSKDVRSLDARKYKNVLQKVLGKYPNIEFVLLGGADATNAARIISTTDDIDIADGFLDLTTRTSLGEAAAIISRCQFYVGSDTGLMHMASAFSVPIIEVSASMRTCPKYWGSTPTRTGPWRVKNIVLQPDHGLDGCSFFCRSERAHCINQISEEELERAIEKMLELFC